MILEGDLYYAAFHDKVYPILSKHLPNPNTFTNFLYKNYIALYGEKRYILLGMKKINGLILFYSREFFDIEVVTISMFTIAGNSSGYKIINFEEYLEHSGGKLSRARA